MSTTRTLSHSVIRTALALGAAAAGLYAGDAPVTPPAPVQAPAPAPVVTAAPPMILPAPTAHRAGDVTIRLITIDANGELSDASHKVLDDLMEQGWRTTGMTLVSSTPPITLAVMLNQPPRRAPMPYRQQGVPGQPMIQPGTPGQPGVVTPPGAEPAPQGAPPAPH